MEEQTKPDEATPQVTPSTDPVIDSAAIPAVHTVKDETSHDEEIDSAAIPAVHTVKDETTHDEEIELKNNTMKVGEFQQDDNAPVKRETEENGTVINAAPTLSKVVESTSEEAQHGIPEHKSEFAPPSYDFKKHNQ